MALVYEGTALDAGASSAVCDFAELREVEKALAEHRPHPVRQHLAAYYISLYEIDEAKQCSPFDELPVTAQLEIIHRTDRIFDDQCL